MTRKDFAPLVIVVLFGLLLQVGLIFLDCTSSPSDSAVRYLEAYYELDPAMAKWSCDSSKLSDHIYNVTAEAAERGFEKSYARYALSHIETRTAYLDHTTAVVHLTAHRRIAINPLYTWVDRLFGFSETREVDETLRVKLEDGHWRVCQAS